MATIRLQTVPARQRNEQAPRPWIFESKAPFFGRLRPFELAKARSNPIARCVRRIPLARRSGTGKQRFDLAKLLPQFLLVQSLSSPRGPRFTRAVRAQ